MQVPRFVVDGTGNYLLEIGESSVSMNKVIVGLLSVLMLLSCQPAHRQPDPGQVVNDSLQQKEASRRIQRIMYYYNNDMHDSLYLQGPLDLDYHREHGNWDYYYITWLSMAEDYTFMGEINKAIDTVKKMHGDANQRENAFGRALSNFAMGLIYSVQTNYKEAADHYQQAIKLYPENSNQSAKNDIFFYYCEALQEIGQHERYDSTLVLWKEGIEKISKDLSMQNKAAWEVMYYRTCFGHHLKYNRINLAAADLDSIKYYVTFEDSQGEGSITHITIASFEVELAKARKDYQRALQYSDVELEMSRKHIVTTYNRALLNRSGLYEDMGRYKEALDYYQRYVSIDDSLANEETREQLNELNKRFEVDELKSLQERERLEHERDRMRNALLMIFVVVLALLMFIYTRQRSAKLLKERNKELKIANERALESSRMKTEFIQQITHEIGTPLNILNGFTEVLTTQDAELSEEEKKDIQQRVMENTVRITSLVNKMLELSDASSKTVIERSDDVKAVDIAEQAAEKVGIRQIPGVDFKILPEDAAGEMMIHTNRVAAVRVLTLLLGNAQKFLSSAGESTQEKKEGRVTLGIKRMSYQEKPAIAYVVEDTGIGIPPEETEHIFEEFVQLNGDYPGTGIGLTVARSMARRMQGDIWVDTSYTKGARFVVALPIA